MKRSHGYNFKRIFTSLSLFYNKLHCVIYCSRIFNKIFLTFFDILFFIFFSFYYVEIHFEWFDSKTNLKRVILATNLLQGLGISSSDSFSL